MNCLKTLIIGVVVLLFLVATVSNRIVSSQSTKPPTGQANVATNDDSVQENCPIDDEDIACWPRCFEPTEAPTGFDDRTWVDHFGYPHSDQMHLQERYRRVDRDHLELTMTLTDPKTYTRPWESQKKIFTLQPPDSKTVSNDGWHGLFEEICAPVDEVDQFNNRIRNRAVNSTEK